jgi:hypothetical protein
MRPRRQLLDDRWAKAKANAESLKRGPFTQEQTCAVELGMSAKGQKWTPQQLGSLFNNFVGAQQERLRDR